MAAERPPEKGTRLTAVEIHDNILEPAKEEMRRPAVSLLMSALASGLVIGRATHVWIAVDPAAFS